MATVIETATDPRPRLWTVDEYSRMADVGILNGKAVELMRGVVTVKETGEPYPWTVVDYYRFGDAGFFHNQRVQLVNGEIIVTNPQSGEHAYAIERITELLVPRYSKELRVRVQLPLRVAIGDEPEPDFALIPRSWRFPPPHPAFAEWVVEVSYSTLAFDRLEKLGIYAVSRIPEYWIVNLVDRQVEVYRTPIEDEEYPRGWRYENVETYQGDMTIKPLASELTVTAAELLG